MSKTLKGFLIGTSVTAVLLGSLSFAGNYSETVQRTYRDIKLKLNGSLITPKDANGKTVEPFIIDGTTYLPVRAVGNALGMDVDWDGNTSTVILEGGASNKYVELTQNLPAYLSGLFVTDVLVNEDGTYTLQGELLAPYTMAWEDFSKIQEAGGMVIDGDFYTYNKVEDQFPTVARLTRENEPASYAIEDMDEFGYVLKTESQFSILYHSSGIKAQITVDKDMMFDAYNMFAGNCRMSVEEYFKSYKAEPIQDIMHADTVLCHFSFENGKCMIDWIDHMAHI